MKKGTAVLSLDPDEGPFSPFEFQAIISRTNEYLAENKISYYEAALIRVFVRLVEDPSKFQD